MSGYVATNWYWRVGGDESRVFSSARNKYVPADDETYVEWRTTREGIVGYDPTTRIDTEDNLTIVLEPYGIVPDYEGTTSDPPR